MIESEEAFILPVVESVLSVVQSPQTVVVILEVLLEGQRAVIVVGVSVFVGSVMIVGLWSNMLVLEREEDCILFALMKLPQRIFPLSLLMQSVLLFLVGTLGLFVGLLLLTMVSFLLELLALFLNLALLLVLALQKLLMIDLLLGLSLFM